jgi:hypothetical protein
LGIKTGISRFYGVEICFCGFQKAADQPCLGQQQTKKKKRIEIDRMVDPILVHYTCSEQTRLNTNHGFFIVGQCNPSSTKSE